MADTTLGLSGIIEQANNYLAQVTTGASALQGVAEEQQNLANTNAKLYESVGNNMVIIESAKQSADLTAQQSKIHAGILLGTNLADASEIVSGLADTIRSEYAKKDAALQRIQEKQSVSILDNPLEYIFNQLTINDDIAAHNAANNRLSAAQDQLTKVNALTQATTQTQEAFKESVTAATMQAANENIANNATIQANAARVQGLVYNAQGIQAALNAPKEALSVMFSVNGAKNAEEQISLAQQHLELARQEFDWKKEEKEKGKQADDYFINRINEGMRLRMGDAAELIVPGSAKATQVLSLLKSNSPAGKIYSEDYLIGEQSAISGTKVLATSPARAIELMHTVPMNLPASASPVKALLDQAMNDMLAESKLPNSRVDIKNPASREAYLNNRTQELLNEQAKNIKPGDAENVYNIGPMGTLLKSSPTLQKLPVVQKLLLDAMEAGVDLNNPNSVFANVAQSVKDGKLTYAEALELTTVYSVGVSTNMEAKQFVALGITPKFSYNTQIQLHSGIFGGKNIVDMTKAFSVGRALNQYLANVQSQEAVHNKLFFNGGKIR